MNSRNEEIINPCVSVILPTFNRAKYIKHAAKTVLEQSYKNLELIIIDDGSSDNTEEVVRSIQDSRVKYIKLGSNKGAPTARNIGIKVAKGRYIAFQDSDDQWQIDKLEKQMAIFANSSHETGVVYTALIRIDGGKKDYIPYWWVKKKEGYIHEELLRGNFVATPSMVVRRECFERVGMFDERLPRLQDWELVLRLSKHYEFRFIEEPLLIAHYTADSLTTNNVARIEALKLIISKHLDDFLQDKDSLSRYYFGIGVFKCLNNDINEGEYYLSEAFGINPNRNVLAEHYFTIGRRLCPIDNKVGRDYLIRALRIKPLDPRILCVLAISLFNQDVYQRLAKFYRASKEKKKNKKF